MRRPFSIGQPIPLAITASRRYQAAMSIWSRIGDLAARIGAGAGSGAMDLFEALRSFLGLDPELRRRVAFSVAMIALSAKMAKADGIVTQDEIRAFQEIFSVPPKETRNVARLYEIAQQDTAGFEAYAARMARLCGSGLPNCAILEDILDGLFHIAKADGLLHERESLYLRRVAQIFAIDEANYHRILARHVGLGAADPYVVLGVERGQSFEEIRRHYRKLVRDNHPDKVTARGLPAEFVAIATTRLAAINAAYEVLEKGFRQL